VLRIHFLKNSFSLFLQSPWVGHGTGSFESVYYAGYGYPKTWSHKLHAPHNEYALTTVHFGLLGLILLLTFFALQWLYFADNLDKKLGQGIVLSFLLVIMANSGLHTTVLGHFYVFFIALFCRPDAFKQVGLNQA